MFFCHNRTQESFPDTSYYHNLAVCLWLTGNTELQHPSVISFRNQVDQLWVPGEPSGSACEHQGSHTNQQEQFGKTVHFTDTGRKVAGFKRWIFVLSCPQALLSGGSDILPIRTSVAFVAVSAAASPGYRAMPTINAKLPADFFFPFV